MKKILFLLLMTVSVYGQVSTGQEQEFDYGIKNNSAQTVTNPDYLTTTGNDGTQGKVLGSAYAKSDRTININGVTQDLSANIDFQVGYADTGVLTFEGLSPNSSTTINIGACKGWVIDNETNPLVPTKTYVDYAGATNVSVPAVGSAIGSYVLLNASGITFITTQPTPAQRKAYIYLGKVGHPSGTITVVANTPDNILSPLGQVRALYNAIDFINEGVSVAPNGANLNVNLTAGYITGNGINFVTDDTTPNRLTVNPQTPATFIYRTQNGAGGGATTTITPGNYDVGGVVTAVPGGSNTATVQYLFYAPGAGLFIQLGQTTYPSLSDAVANADKETFTIYPNFVDNVIPIGQLVVVKSATDLSNTSQARFLKADKFGELGGASAGISTATLQSAYNNSLVPQITTSTLGAMTVRRGSASDTDNVLAGQNGAGTNTFSVKGNGDVTAFSYNGYTPENTANKSDSYTVSSSTTYASTKALVDGLSTRAPSSGSANYIQNQNASAQTADMWISGSGRFDGNINQGSYGNVGSLTSIRNLADPNTINRLVYGTDNTGYRFAIGKNVSGTITDQFTLFDTGAATFASTVTALNGTLIGGTGTTNYIPKFTGSNSLGNSLIYDDGTNIGIGATSTGHRLSVLTSNQSDNPTLGSNTVGGQSLLGGFGLYGLVQGVSGSGYVWNQVQRTDGNTSTYPYILQPLGGNVLIGTTTDNGVDKLQVNGSVSATSYTGGAALTGTPTAPTATAGTNTTQIATTAFVMANARPYKVYTALISQSGTSAPTETVLENTLGASGTWSYSSTGTYYLDFPANTLSSTKTSVLTTKDGAGSFGVVFHGSNTTSTSRVIFNVNNSSGPLDSQLTKSTIEIRVYP